MELLQLRYFYESAKTESFARTAEKYMVPTTSVSASVRRLEQELGCQLFDRTCNRITLNANGKRFQQSLCKALGELDDVVEELSGEAADDREIKLLVRSLRRRVTEAIILYSKLHPKTTFKTVFDFREKDLDSYHLIIDADINTYPDHEKFELMSKKLQLKTKPGDPLCQRSLQLKELCNEKFLSMGEESNYHKILVSACGRAGFTPNISVMCNDIECYERLIDAGMGIALGIHTGTAGQYLDVTDFHERYTVCGYYRKEDYYGNVKSFLDFLRQTAITE